MLAAASASGGPAVAPAQLATASGGTEAMTSAPGPGSPLARSSRWCAGDPGSGARPAVTTSAPASAACRQTWPPRNPLAPRISSRIAPVSPSRLLVVLAGLEPGQVRGLTEPGDGLEKPLVPGVPRPPPGALAQLRRVAHQPHHLGVLGTQPLRVLHDIGIDPHKSGDILSQLADRDVVAGPAVEQLADHGRGRRLAERHERLGGVEHVREVPGRVERTQ